MIRNRFFQAVTIAFFALSTVTPTDADSSAMARETKIALPVFVPDADAQSVDPDFRSDVAFLAPTYGTPVDAEIYQVAGLGPDEVAMKLLVPSTADKDKIYEARAIVELPILCGMVETFECDEFSQPNGVLQLTKVDPALGYEAIIRFPDVPGISVRLRAADKNGRKIRLWVIKDNRLVLKRIDLMNFGVPEQRAMPVLHGVSTIGLPKKRLDRFKRLGKGTSAKIVDRDGRLFAELVLGGKDRAGYARLSKHFCEALQKSDFCTLDTSLAYAWLTVEHEIHRAAYGIRASITLRRPNSSQETEFVFFRHGLEPKVNFDIPELEGFVFMLDHAMPAYDRFSGAAHELRFVPGKEIDDLAERAAVLGYSFD